MILEQLPRNTTQILKVDDNICTTVPVVPHKTKILVSDVNAVLSRGTMVNRIRGTHENLYIYLFLLAIFGAIHHGPP